MDTEVHIANWWKPVENNTVICNLCPRHCKISPDKYGFCGVRRNDNGKLISESYGYPVALQVDPIEKKPLLEFMPRTKVFSIGTFGCNLDCVFCQNDHLSRGCYNRSTQKFDYIAPEIIVMMAQRHNCRSIAYTYNEPTVFAEYALDIAKLAKKQELANVLVSNGYISLEAARDLYPHIDAANIDMKGFSEDFYSNMTHASLSSVLEAIKYFYSLGKHLELTNLVIPASNDSDDMINAYLDWVEKELDKNVPLHFSAYHPAHNWNAPPTPPDTLRHIQETAEKRGFEHVYLGNVRL